MLIKKYDEMALFKQQEIRAKKAIDDTLQRFKPKILGRSKTTDRPYNNQTYRLTHTGRAVYFDAINTLSFYAEAQDPKTHEYYAIDVMEYYSLKTGQDQNWFKNAADFYKDEMEKYFLKQMIEGIK